MPFCTKCGQAVETGDEFCGRCGANVKAKLPQTVGLHPITNTAESPTRRRATRKQMVCTLASMLVFMLAFQVVRPSLFANIYPNWLEIIAAGAVAGIGALVGGQVARFLDRRRA